MSAEAFAEHRETSGRGAETAAPADGPAAYTVTRADDASRADWDDYVNRAASAELYHDYRWRTLIEDVFGHETAYLVAHDAQSPETQGRARTSVRGVLPLVHLKSRLFGDFWVSMPYLNYGGVLADSPGAREALLAEAERHARESGAGHIELRHRDEPALDWPAREDKVTLLLDLPASAEALWQSFRPKLRSQIRRPEKDGAVARQGGAELLDDFYAVFARNMRDLGTPVYDKRFFAAILSAFPEEAKLFIVDLAGTPVAAGLVLAHRGTVEIPWASSLREANRSGVNMLLYWRVLADAADCGFGRFDFGRSTRDSGTYRFKTQWGAQPQRLRWHYWLAGGGPLPQLTPSNPKYRAAIAMWRKLPVPVANRLGPRIVKYLP